MKNNKHLFTSPIIACTLASTMLITPMSFASNLSINYSQLAHPVTLQDQSVLLKPTGSAIFLSTDISEHWNLGADYQAWQDDENYQNLAIVDLELLTWGASVNYYQDNWFFTTSISRSEDDLLISNPRRQENHRNENTQTTSIGALAGYNGSQGNWLYDVSIGAQYSDWDIETKQQKVPKDKPISSLTEQFSDSSTSVNAALSLAHFWSLTENTGVLAGAMISWNYMLSNDDDLVDSLFDSSAVNGATFSRTTSRLSQRTILQPTSGNNNSASRVTSGDDNYGQLSFYLSYDISQSLAIDFDTSLEIASDNSSQTWSAGLSYSF